mgnify:CR=1 FL=1
MAADLREEAEQDGKACSDTHDTGIVHLRQSQHAGILAVCSIGRCAEETRQAGGKAVAQQGAVQAGVGQVRTLTGGTDGCNVADMLHHGGQCDGRNGDAGADAELCHAACMDRKAKPIGLTDRVKIHFPHQQGHNVRAHNANEDGALYVAHQQHNGEHQANDKQPQHVGVQGGHGRHARPEIHKAHV